VAIDVSSYVTLGTGVSAATALANRTGLASAIAAAMAVNDYVTIPEGTRLEIAVIPSSDTFGSSSFAIKIATSGALDIRCATVNPASRPIIALYYEYSTYDGGAATLTKTRRNHNTPTPPIAEFDGTGATFRRVSGSGYVSATGENWAGQGVVADMTAVIAGVNDSNYNGSKTITSVGVSHLGAADSTYLKWTQSSGNTTSSDADVTIDVGWIFNNHRGDIFYSTQKVLTWRFDDLDFEMLDGTFTGTYRNSGQQCHVVYHVPGDSGVTSYTDYGANNLTCNRVDVTGHSNGFYQSKGYGVQRFYGCRIRGNQTTISFHDTTGSNASPGGGTVIAPCPTTGRTSIQYCNPLASAASDDGIPNGSGVYISPNRYLIATTTVFWNFVGTCLRQYSSGSAYTAYNSLSPDTGYRYNTTTRAYQLGGSGEIVGGLVQDCTFNFDNTDFDSVSHGGQAWIPSDAPVVSIWDNSDSLKGNTDQCGSIMHRSAYAYVTDSAFEGSPWTGPDLTSETQVQTYVYVETSTVTDGRDGVTSVACEPGWHVTYDDCDFTCTDGDSQSIFLASAKLASGYRLEGSLYVKANCTFTNSSVSEAARCISITTTASTIIGEDGVSGPIITGNWTSGINIQTETTTGGVIYSPVLSGVTNGRGIRFQSTGSPANNADAGAVTQPAGNYCLYPDTGTAGGVRFESPSPDYQNLRIRVAIDPTTRTASANTVKLSPNYTAHTVTGTVTTIQFGLSAAQNFTRVFAGQTLTLIAGASLTTNSGGNVTWLTTGARTTGARVYLTLSADGTAFTEVLPTVTLLGTDLAASETGGTGTLTLSRTGDYAASMTVNIATGGTATGGTDYTSLSSTATIAAGATTGTITVTPLSDGNIEGDETVTVSLDAGSYTIGEPSSQTVTITDDIPAPTDAGSTPISMTPSLTDGEVFTLLQTATPLFKPLVETGGKNPWKK
jgi:hypothetical protein